MNLLNHLAPKAQSVEAVATLVEKNAAEIVAARASLPALRAQLDEASLRGTGDAAALAALRSAEAEVDRLTHRADVLARTMTEAQALAEKRRVQALRVHGTELAGALDKALSKYASQAAGTAATLGEIENLDEQARANASDLHAVGEQAVPRAHVEEILRHAHLPALDGADHRSRTPTVNYALAAFARQRDEAAAAHASDMARLKTAAVRMILRH